MKDVIFMGRSLEDLKAFPQLARREAGFQIWNIQNGKNPDDWKPMKDFGSGVIEIRIHENGEFRIFYVAKFEESIYVLHVFQKKTQKTSKHDIEIAKSRYHELIRERKSK